VKRKGGRREADGEIGMQEFSEREIGKKEVCHKSVVNVEFYLGEGKKTPKVRRNLKYRGRSGGTKGKFAAGRYVGLYLC